jgi:hypothetical protein
LSRRQALALAGGTVAAALVASAPGRRVMAAPTDYGITIRPRDTWAGDTRPPVGELGPEDVRFLLVHHTASANGADPIGTMRGVYDFHTSADKGWPDVAYNFFIDQNGVVYEARTGSLTGPVAASATGGNQGFAQLVCLLGDFTAQNPTDAALASLNSTLAWLADRYGLDTTPGAQTTFTSRGSNRWPAGTEVTAAIVSGHRDMSQTACPGDTFYPYLVANVQREVHALRSPTSSAPPTDPPTDPAPTDPTPTDRSATPSTTAPAPAATTAPAPPATEPAPTGAATSTPDTTVPATVATGSVVVPPASSVDEAPAPATTRRDSSNATALAVAAGASVLVGAGAVYVGVRGRHDGSSEPSSDEPGPSADDRDAPV